MIKLMIESIDGYIYNLVDENGNKYSLNIEFYDLEVLPNKNDYLIINHKLLKENNILSFGAIDSIYGKQIEKSDDKDLIILIINNQQYYLKRLYG